MASDRTPGGRAAPSEADPQPLADAPPLNLLDMPAAWLQLLPAAVGDDMILPLLSCCRALMDLVLSQRTVRVEFRARITRDQQAAAQAKLLTACKYASCVNLTFQFDQVTAHNSLSAGRMMTSTMAAAGWPLTAITSVEMTNLDLDSLVPSWLTSTCPNMRRLCLKGCTITHAVEEVVVTASVPACPQLKELQLQQLRRSTRMSQPELLQWQRQLSALVNLGSLSLHGDLWCEFWLRCLPVLRSQLTQLRLEHTGVHRDSVFAQGLWQLGSCYPFVRDLHLHGIIVGDQVMEALLGLHSLRNLECKAFHLQHSYSHRPCPWTQLGFTELNVRSVDRLPLGGVQQFTVPVGVVIPSQELAADARVAAKVVMCGIHWGPIVTVTRYDGRYNGTTITPADGYVDATCMQALIPIFSTCTGSVAPVEQLHFRYVRPVTSGFLTAMGQHLSSANLHQIRFADCTFSSQQVLPLLLPSMPHSVRVVRLSVETLPRLTEEQVTEMCVHACRPLALMVEGGNSSWPWGAGWQGRVQAAMAAAGHQHVML